MCSCDGLFLAEAGKWTRFVLWLNVSSFRITSSFTTVALLLFSLLFAYVSHHICLVLAATPPHYHFLPISLNSLDLAGFEIAESSWLTRYYHNSCRCRWYQYRWCNRAQMRSQRRPWFLLCFVSCWSVVEPSWDDRGSSSWVIFFSFGFVRSRTMCVLWMMYELYVHCVKWRL